MHAGTISHQLQDNTDILAMMMKMTMTMTVCISGVERNRAHMVKRKVLMQQQQQQQQQEKNKGMEKMGR